MLTTETTELRLHQEQSADGFTWIWFSRRGQYTAYPMTPTSFVSQEWVHAAPVVQLLGTAENAPLIEALYRARHLQGTPTKIQVGSPWLCELEAESRPPITTIFNRMVSLDHLRPSQGGWHNLSRHDYVSYALAHAIYVARGRCTGVADKFLQAHPAWTALSFLPTLNKTRSALLLALLLDPRWYIDPENPDRSARLKSHLGLGPARGPASPRQLIQAVIEDRADDMPTALVAKTAKVRIVLDTWAGMDRETALQGGVDAPCNFLWRIALGSEQLAVGLLRACHVFLRFLGEVWTSAISDGHPDLFVPEHFFRDSAVTQAWREHRNRCCSGDVPEM
jgi:hypothetical protein